MYKMYKVSSVVNSSKPIIGYLLQDNYYYYEICRNQSLEQMQILMEYFVESLQMTWGGFFLGRQWFLHLEQSHLPVWEEASICLVSWRPGSVFYTWSSSRAHPPLAPPPWWRPADTCPGWWALSVSAGYPPHCHGPHIAFIRNQINVLCNSFI